MVYMVTWIPSIYPLHVSSNIPAPWILWVMHDLILVPKPQGSLDDTVALTDHTSSSGKSVVSSDGDAVY